MPLPRKLAESQTEVQPGAAMVIPVPLPRQQLPQKAPEELAGEVLLESDKSESNASTKTSSSDSGIEDGKSTPTSEEEKVCSNSPSLQRGDFIPITKYTFKVVETPETEQPPSLPQSEASEENIDITKDFAAASKIQLPEEEVTIVAHGDSLTPSPIVTPAPSSAAASPASTPRSGLNGSLVTAMPGHASMGEHPETSSPYINGGIINTRYSYSGSMASESMDMSKGNMSMSARVSHECFCTGVTQTLWWEYSHGPLKTMLHWVVGVGKTNKRHKHSPVLKCERGRGSSLGKPLLGKTISRHPQKN